MFLFMEMAEKSINLYFKNYKNCKCNEFSDFQSTYKYK